MEKYIDGRARVTTDEHGFYSVSKKIPPAVFWIFFLNGWEFLINFLLIYYAIISTLDYKFIFKYLQLWQSYAILRRPPSEILRFTRTLTSKVAYWANDVIDDVMSYPTCLLTLLKCLFHSDLPQTTINKAINDLCKRLNACVLARFGHFAYIMWTG